jgi:glucose-1-phosphatase
VSSSWSPGGSRRRETGLPKSGKSNPKWFLDLSAGTTLASIPSRRYGDGFSEVRYRFKMVGDGHDFVLFDLGGVLVRLGGVVALQRLAEIETEEEVWRRWLTCPWVRRFERGRCSPDEFAAGVVAEWRLPIGPDRFLTQFRTWPEALFDGAEEMVAEVRSQIPVGCLSNTNVVHWADQVSRWRLEEMFDVCFLSHRLGLIKPDREVFDHVIGALDLPAERIVFFDDNDANIQQARAIGVNAIRVRGVQETAEALVRLGALPSTFQDRLGNLS